MVDSHRTASEQILVPAPHDELLAKECNTAFENISTFAKYFALGIVIGLGIRAIVDIHRFCIAIDEAHLGSTNLD